VGVAEPYPKQSANKVARLLDKALRDGYRDQEAPVQRRQVEAVALERRASDLVNAAHGLTAEEVETL